MQRDSGAGHPDRMADGDGASVGVHPLGVDPQFLGGGQRDGGEGLVDLDDIEVVETDAFLGHRLADRVGGLALQCRIRSGDDAVSTDLAQPGQPQLLGFRFVHHHDRACAIGDLGGGSGGDGAVLAERGPQTCQRLGRGVGADALVLGEFDRITLTLRDLHRHHLVGEDAVFPGPGSFLMRRRGEFVLLGAGELIHVVALLGQRPHGLVGEDVVQTVVGEVVECGDIAVFVAGPAVHQQMRRLGHRLLTSGDDDVELPGTDQLVGQRDGVDARQTHLVDGQRGHIPADSAGHGRLTGRHLPGARGQHLPHDHVLHRRGRKTGLLEGTRDGDRTEITAGEVLQRTHQLADRRAGSSNNHRRRHAYLQAGFERFKNG